MNDLGLGFQLLGYGLGGVFSVLILFYIIIVGLVKIFPNKENNK